MLRSRDVCNAARWSVEMASFGSKIKINPSVYA
jgi:hypothetical protein